MQTTVSLAIDTSSDSCSVALKYGSGLIETQSFSQRSHGSHLLPLVDQVLTKASLSMKEVQRIAVCRGPGSFTGLRIGVSAAQGLAFGSQKPLLGISSLSALAWQYWNTAQQHPQDQSASDRSEPDHIAVALDARMNEVYWAIYQFGKADFSLVSAPAVSDFDALRSALSGDRKPFKVAFVGSGWRLPDLAGLVDDKSVLNDAPLQASTVLSVLDGVSEITVLKQVFDLSIAEGDQVLEPLYLRNEVAWQKRERIRQA